MSRSKGEGADLELSDVPSAFVGRERELAQVQQLLDGGSLVTVTGPGGVGKTRLARRVAGVVGSSLRDGAVFVDLSAIDDPELVAPAVLKAVGGQYSGSQPAEQPLLARLCDRQVLVVLDNCEQVVAGVATLVHQLLRGCPEVRLLATSREVLQVPGEHVLRLGALEVPAADSPFDESGAQVTDAVRLLTDRAEAVVPGFEVTERTWPAIVRIVRQLEGLPLAIELAASRLRSLSVTELAERLDERFQVLTQGSRVAADRHQTLRLCVEWSYTLCSPSERLLWDRLSVFAGGFELDAVEQVAMLGALSCADTLDLLSGLVDKSVVTRVEGSIPARFTMMEMLRDFGLERLESRGEYAEVRERHCRFFAEVVSHADALSLSVERGEWWRRLDREMANVRVALDWAARHPRPERPPTRLTRALWLYWASHGLYREARSRLEEALATDTEPSLDRLQALRAAVVVSGQLLDPDSGRELAERARLEAPGVGGGYADAIVTDITAIQAFDAGDYPSALTGWARAAAAYRQEGAALPLKRALGNIQAAASLVGDPDLLEQAYREGVELIEAPDERTVFEGFYAMAQAWLAWTAGDVGRAREWLDRCLRLYRRAGPDLVLLWALDVMVVVTVDEGDLTRAATLVGAAQRLGARIGARSTPMPPINQAFDAAVRRCRESLGEEVFARAAATGETLSRESVFRHALREPSAATQPGELGATDDGPLTAREREVAALVAEGLTNREIAARLFVTPRTVRGHLESILGKLGVGSRTEVATWYHERRGRG